MSSLIETGNELDRYLSAHDVLVSVLEQLDRQTDLRQYQLGDSTPTREGLETLIGMLCQQARAAQHLASNAESLCAALAADRYQHAW